MVFQSGCGLCFTARGETGCCPNSFASSSSSLQSSGNGQPTPAASARSRYSWTVPSPIRQLRAICRCPNLNSNRNRRTSLTFRMDDLLAGTLFSLWMEFQCRLIVQRRCTSCCLPVENIPLQAEHHSARRQKCSPSHRNRCSPSERNAVRNHNGIVFGFRAESRSPSTGFPTHAVRSHRASPRAEPRSGPSVFEFEVLTSAELAQRLKVKESWVVDQSKQSRTSDPIPVFRLGSIGDIAGAHLR